MIERNGQAELRCRVCDRLCRVSADHQTYVRRADEKIGVVTIKPTDAWTRAEKDAARAVLLEPSPYETDGGELIGRDPRKVSAEEVARDGLEGHPLSKVIRAWRRPSSFPAAEAEAVRRRTMKP